MRVHNPRMIVLKFPMAPWNTMILGRAVSRGGVRGPGWSK